MPDQPLHLSGPVCLIVPCYNEAKRLDIAAFRRFLGEANDVTVLFVDDGSSDQTFQVLTGLAGEFTSRTHVLRCNPNRGKAEAVRQGMLHALEHCNAAVVGFWDADLATPLISVSSFLQVLAHQPEIEMIFGSRVQLLGRFVKRSAVRHYLGRIFATAVSLALHLPIYDTQCGAKLFRVNRYTRQIFEQPFLSKWVFDVEIIARYQRLFQSQSRKLDDAIYEYPLEVWSDVAGSKVKPSDFFVAFWDVLRIRSKYLG